MYNVWGDVLLPLVLTYFVLIITTTIVLVKKFAPKKPTPEQKYFELMPEKAPRTAAQIRDEIARSTELKLWEENLFKPPNYGHLIIPPPPPRSGSNVSKPPAAPGKSQEISPTLEMYNQSIAANQKQLEIIVPTMLEIFEKWVKLTAEGGKEIYSKPLEETYSTLRTEREAAKDNIKTLEKEKREYIKSLEEEKAKNLNLAELKKTKVIVKERKQFYEN